VNKSKELKVRDLVPCPPYTLETLVACKILDLETAVRVSGQELSVFEEYVIDADLASRLIQAGVQVPRNRIEVFGDNFSQIVEYNTALQQSILTEADGASPEFVEALYSWNENLKPFPYLKHSREYFAQAQPGDGLQIMWGLAAYMRESLTAGRSPEEVGRVIEAKIDELLGWDSYFGTTPDTPYGQKIQRELGIIRANSNLVFVVYRRIYEFRERFREQIKFLAELYSKPRWSENTRACGYKMAKFLR
jgi:hypothetical protein